MQQILTENSAGIIKAKLPVLTGGIEDLLSRLTNDRTEFVELARTVESYPTISARLLALANSPWSAPVAPVASLEKACARLGFATVRCVSIALAVASPFNPRRCPSFDAKRYWCSALLVADGAAKACTLIHGSSPDLTEPARTAGLLHNIGLLWLADSMPEETDAALTRTSTEAHLTVYQAFIEQCGFSYGQAGYTLAQAWNLPEPLRSAIDYRNTLHQHTEAGALARLVASAALAVSSLYRGELTNTQLDDLASLHLPGDVFDSLVQRARDTFAPTQELADSLFSR